jgi:polysaccharide deacetylase 2 family uncharacterized protein YibQ
MPRPSRRRPSKAPAARKTRRGRTGGPDLRVVAAVVVVVVAVGLLLLVARRRQPEVAPAAAPSAIGTVREVASRFDCPPGRVVESPPSAPDGPVTITVAAPRGFPVGDFTQKLEAAAHNSGGRLEPRQMTEKGGYGLARLDGVLDGRKVRIVIVGEEPRPTPRPKPPQPARGRAGRLAIVLDDAGNSLGAVKDLERLPAQIAVAVLPNAPQSREVVRELGRQGREVLLHMPMEPMPGHGPGPGEGAIVVGESPDEVAARISSALAVVDNARGVNNHMGSRATADMPTMRAVMAVLKPTGLYFLDSRTTPDTVAERAAREAGVPALRREVFLDNVAEPDAVKRSLDEAAGIAAADGEAVAIGHVHAVTVAVLAAELGDLRRDVVLVRPSQLLR